MTDHPPMGAIFRNQPDPEMRRRMTTGQTLCHSNGPRIGGEGTPFCVLPKMHEGNHVPDESWHGSISYWSDHSFAGVPNADLRSAAERHVEKVETPDARAALWEVIAAVRDNLPRHPGDATTDDILDALLENDALVLDFIAQAR